MGTEGESTALHDNTDVFHASGVLTGEEAVNVTEVVGSLVLNLFWVAT